MAKPLKAIVSLFDRPVSTMRSPGAPIEERFTQGKISSTLQVPEGIFLRA